MYSFGPCYWLPFYDFRLHVVVSIALFVRSTSRGVAAAAATGKVEQEQKIGREWMDHRSNALNRPDKKNSIGRSSFFPSPQAVVEWDSCSLSPVDICFCFLTSKF